MAFEHFPESGESVYIRIFICDIIPCNYNALFVLQTELLVTVMKWCSKKWYCILWLCGIHRDNLVLSMSRRSSVLSLSNPRCLCMASWLCIANLLCLQLLPLYTTLNDFSTEWTQCCYSCSSACVTLHVCVAHMLVCWFHFLCRKPEWDCTVICSLLSYIFPLHSKPAHAHNYPWNRYQALLFWRPAIPFVVYTKNQAWRQGYCG